VSQYMMHDTITGEGVTRICLNMQRRPKVRQMEPGQARHHYDAIPCPVCMPFKVARRVAVEQRA
jgi:hypothetical protein